MKTVTKIKILWITLVILLSALFLLPMVLGYYKPENIELSFIGLIWLIYLVYASVYYSVGLILIAVMFFPLWGLSLLFGFKDDIPLGFLRVGIIDVFIIIMGLVIYVWKPQLWKLSLVLISYAIICLSAIIWEFYAYPTP